MAEYLACRETAGAFVSQGDNSDGSAIRSKMSNKTKSRKTSTSKKMLAVLAIVGGLTTAVLLLPGQIVDFKTNFPQASDYITNMIYSPEAWTGTFDKYPEGVADMSSLGISTNVDAALEIEVVEGNRLDGRIWWQGSCDFGGPYSGLLLEGKIKRGGSSAEVIIWELVEGHRKDIAQGLLEVDGLMIRFSKFPMSLGVNESVIAKNPEPVQLEDWPNLYCANFENTLRHKN